MLDEKKNDFANEASVMNTNREHIDVDTNEHDVLKDESVNQLSGNIDICSDAVNMIGVASVTANRNVSFAHGVTVKHGANAPPCVGVTNPSKLFNFMSINVCSLLAKLKYPDFHEFIEEMDFLCQTETKLDDLGYVDLDGFTYFMKNRSVYKRKSGGIALFVRNKLLDRIKIVEISLMTKWYRQTSTNIISLLHNP